MTEKIIGGIDRKCVVLSNYGQILEKIFLKLQLWEKFEFKKFFRIPLGMVREFGFSFENGLRLLSFDSGGIRLYEND